MKSHVRVCLITTAIFALSSAGQVFASGKITGVTTDKSTVAKDSLVKAVIHGMYVQGSGEGTNKMGCRLEISLKHADGSVEQTQFDDHSIDPDSWPTIGIPLFMKKVGLTTIVVKGSSKPGGWHPCEGKAQAVVTVTEPNGEVQEIKKPKVPVLIPKKVPGPPPVENYRKGESLPPVYKSDDAATDTRKGDSMPPVYRPNGAPMDTRKGDSMPPVYKSSTPTTTDEQQLQKQ